MSKIKNPLNARHMEHNEHQDGSIARKGGAPSSLCSSCSSAPLLAFRSLATKI